MRAVQDPVNQEDEWLTEVYAERGQEIPENLRPKVETPDIGDFDEQILHDYVQVRTDRPQSGFGGLAQIPWSALHRYALHAGYLGAEHDWWISIMQRIDSALLKNAQKNSEKQHRAKRRHPKHS